MKRTLCVNKANTRWGPEADFFPDHLRHPSNREVDKRLTKRLTKRFFEGDPRKGDKCES
jgi:hypothetical protein